MSVPDLAPDDDDDDDGGECYVICVDSHRFLDLCKLKNVELIDCEKAV